MRQVLLAALPGVAVAACSSGDGRPEEATFAPQMLAVDKDGDLYISNRFPQRIYKVVNPPGR
jgi:hypothetical protein